MKPIPVQMLRHTVTLKAPAYVSAYQNADYEDYYIHRTCVQRTERQTQGTTSTDAAAAATLFVDARLSYPRLEWMRMKQTADENGGSLVLVHDGTAYTVTEVRELLDDHARVHHWEVALT